jgi:hypothetical protein
MRETNPEIESLKQTEQEFDDSINRLDRIANPKTRCDRCDTESFLLFNGLSGFYECERCAPGLHAWSRRGVGTNRHISFKPEMVTTYSGPLKPINRLDLNDKRNDIGSIHYVEGSEFRGPSK